MSLYMAAGIIHKADQLSGEACALAAPVENVCERLRDLGDRIAHLVHEPSGEQLRAVLNATGLSCVGVVLEWAESRLLVFSERDDLPELGELPWEEARVWLAG